MSLKVVILGAGGLVGARMATTLVNVQTLAAGGGPELPLARIVLFDMLDAGIPAECRADPRVRIALGDLTDGATMQVQSEPAVGLSLCFCLRCLAFAGTRL